MSHHSGDCSGRVIAVSAIHAFGAIMRDRWLGEDLFSIEPSDMLYLY